MSVGAAKAELPVGLRAPLATGATTILRRVDPHHRPASPYPEVLRGAVQTALASVETYLHALATGLLPLRDVHLEEHEDGSEQLEVVVSLDLSPARESAGGGLSLSLAFLRPVGVRQRRIFCETKTAKMWRKSRRRRLQ